jgi:hypothetical protein
MPINSILIRFIRKSSDTKGLTDDRVSVTNLGNDQYKLVYTYGDMKKKARNSLVLSDTQMFKWLRHTIALLENDDEPFEAVQMDLPFMPSVIFNVSRLDKVYNALLDAFEFHLNNWTVSTPVETEDVYEDLPQLVSSPVPSGRHHLFLD